MTKIKYQTTQNNDQSTDTHQKTVPLIAEKIMHQRIKGKRAHPPVVKFADPTPV